MDGGNRSSGTLPPIGSFRAGTAKEEGQEFYPRRQDLTLDTSTRSVPRSSSPYNGGRPYPTNLNDHNAATTAAQSLAAFAQRRSSGDQPEPRSGSSQGIRYSLPSLYEVLGMEKDSPMGTDNPSGTPLAPRGHQNLDSTAPTSHPSQPAMNSERAAQERKSPTNWNVSRAPYVGHIGPASPAQRPSRLHNGDGSISPHAGQRDGRFPPQSFMYDDDKKQAPHHRQQLYGQISKENHAPDTQASTSPTRSPSSTHHHPSQSGSRHPHDNSRPSGIRKHSKAPYGESVKRHLESFDLEQSLNGVYDASKQLLDFSDFYRQKAHQTQKSGPLPGSTPDIKELEDMIENGSHVQDMLNQIKDVVVQQQAALAERSRENAMKAAPRVPEDHGNFHDESKDGTFGGSDPKRRRGRAAPPGRCHSCNRAETPEWRRGPDGARTLCNACGLHYAKLTRKLGGGKGSGGGSNLRPKAMESGTTVS